LGVHNGERILTAIALAACVAFAGYGWFILARWLFKLVME
jgi:hypothetical protein